MQTLYNHSKIYLNFLSRILFFTFLFIILSGATTNSFNNSSKVSYSKSYIVEKGDAIIQYIDRQTISKNQTLLLKNFFLNKEYKNILQDGKKITFYYQIETKENPIFNLLTIEIGKKKLLEVYIKNNKAMGRITTPFKKSFAKLVIDITNNDLKQNLLKAGISDDENLLHSTLNEKINLKRNLKKGDKISLIVEKYTNQDLSIIEYGDVLYASLQNKGKVIDIYRYNCPYDKVNKFYYSNGQSASYSDLIKPIPDAKINSKFGYRKDPISGKTKMHNGVDYGASKGTPIYSASSGIIKFIGWQGSYGHHIKIEHDKKIKTEYGHLLKFAPNIKNGSKVTKGQLIGYVGSSGRATGSHLHYSVLINNKYVDPLAFQLSSKSILTKNHYRSFLNYKDMIQSLSNKLSKNAEITLKVS